VNHLAVLILFVVGVCTTLLAQQNVRQPGIYKSWDEINLELNQSISELGIVAGQSTLVAEAGGGRILIRRRQAGPNNASVHDEMTEIYQIISGTGTFITGGTIPDPENRTAGIQGGIEQYVKPGDFIIIPPGTPHWFSEINESITYAETRFPVLP
tara:strand:+ start:21232 stop:21696 length:465 start_codon:yes stop_codon:yes gene_type:complete